MPVQKIHPTALVDAKAELDSSVLVGPYTVIGPHVKVDAGTTIGAHCVIEGHTTIGCDNRIFQFNSLGAIPQDKKYAGEPCELVIGHRNTVREFCTFNIGSPGDTGVTRVADDNWIMAYVHLAHDCQVGSNTIFANNSQLAGHVHVGDWVILGGFTVVHQFVRLGFEAAGGGRHFFDQRRILLGDLVHLRDRLANLRDAGGLLIAGRADLAHDVGDAFDGAHHFGHGGPGLVHQHGAFFDALDTGVD